VNVFNSSALHLTQLSNKISFRLFKLTIDHLATLELSGAVQLVATAFIEARHVITIRTFSPAFFVEA